MKKPQPSPINPEHYALFDEFCREFNSNEPLPGFVVVPDFLTKQQLSDALAGCDRAELAIFCGHAPEERPNDLQNEFFEPVAGRRYITIHHRPTKPVPQLQELHASFTGAAMRNVMKKLTGIELSRDEHRSVLTAWGPCSFLHPHTDANLAGRPTRLVVSLSLTRKWEKGFGGWTGFQWSFAGPIVRVPPVLNQAVLFRPFQGSFHWVEQIGENAPDRLRYTWTMEYV